MHQESIDNKISEDLNTDSGPAVGGRNRWIVLVAVVVTVATVAAYWGVGNSSFIDFDDNYYVTDNYHVKHGLSFDGITWAFTAFAASNWHPLTWLSHMLDVQLFGLAPGWHHLVNLFFHCLNAILLLWFLVYTTEKLWPSAFVAAIFALHPLHVESVAWVAERKDVLSTCFWLLTMLAYVSYVKKSSRNRYILALVLFALGLMAKPMLVTLPVILLLLDYWPLSRVGVPLRRLLLEKLPFAMLSVASASVTVAAQQNSLSQTGAMGIWISLTNAVVSCWRYIRMMVWPTGLAAYYPHPNQPLALAAIVVGAMIIAATWFAFRRREKYPYIIFGWLWYLITLVPVIGVVQVGNQSHADRYTYVPLVGLFIIAAWAAHDIVRRFASARIVFAAVSVVILVVTGLLTRQTVGYWKDSVTVFSRAVAVVPDNPRMEACLGDALVHLGRYDEALPHLDKAITYKDQDGSAYNALGKIYRDKGDIDKAIGYFTEANKYYWMRPKGERNLGVYLVSLGRYGQAVPHLEKAVELDPYNTDALSLLAIALCETGKPVDAGKAIDRAMRFEPEKGIVNYARGHVLAKVGNLAGALDAYKRSVAVEPTYAAYGNMGQIQVAMGKLADAAESCRRAIAIEPNRPEAHSNLAILLSELGEKDKAIEQIKLAMKLAPNDADLLALYQQLTGTK